MPKISHIKRNLIYSQAPSQAYSVAVAAAAVVDDDVVRELTVKKTSLTQEHQQVFDTVASTGRQTHGRTDRKTGLALVMAIF